jgi:hypothetical protein
VDDQPQLSLPERTALLALMTFVKEASNPELEERYGFPIKKAARERLVDLGFVNAYQRGRPYVHELTDKGWRRCREELAKEVPKPAQKAYRLLYGVLHCLDAYMRNSRLELADIFLPATAGDGNVDVEKRIRKAYESLAEKPAAWVSLTRLRSALSELPRRDVDDALRRMDLQSHVFLISEFDLNLLSEADRAAAIRIGNEDKHLLSIERS